MYYAARGLARAEWDNNPMAFLNSRLGFTRFEADEYYEQALAAYKKRDFDGAYDAMTKALERLPGNAEYYAARGFFHLEDGAIIEAKADFEAALKHDPYEMLAHYGNGMLAYRDEEWETALQHFTKAYHADAQRGETLYYLGMVYLRLKRTADAINMMELARQALEKADDKRVKTAERWIRELGKLADKTAKLLEQGE
jgi:tetratricopeptide (TPR) repeat protein